MRAEQKEIPSPRPAQQCLGRDQPHETGDFERSKYGFQHGLSTGPFGGERIWVPQPWRWWHFGAGQILAVRAVLCFAGCSAATWPWPSAYQQHHQPTAPNRNVSRYCQMTPGEPSHFFWEELHEMMSWGLIKAHWWDLWGAEKVLIAERLSQGMWSACLWVCLPLDHFVRTGLISICLLLSLQPRVWCLAQR